LFFGTITGFFNLIDCISLNNWLVNWPHCSLGFTNNGGGGGGEGNVTIGTGGGKVVGTLGILGILGTFCVGGNFCVGKIGGFKIGGFKIGGFKIGGFKIGGALCCCIIYASGGEGSGGGVSFKEFRIGGDSCCDLEVSDNENDLVGGSGGFDLDFVKVTTGGALISIGTDFASKGASRSFVKDDIWTKLVGGEITNFVDVFGVDLIRANILVKCKSKIDAS